MIAPTGHLTSMDSDLPSAASLALQQACQFASDSVRPDGHWCGELKSNCTITAEYVFLLQAIGHRRLADDREALCRYLLSEQNEDGSWSNAPCTAGDVSTSTEAYLALKLLGETCDISPGMRKAQRWITAVGGGVEKVRVFTRIYFATFGLFPWSAVPELPAELIFMPAAAPINIYKLSSWARSTVIPLLVVCHHQPVYSLPNGRSPNNDFIDELWRDPSKKDVPYHKGLYDMLSNRDLVGSIFTVVDKSLKFLGGLRSYNPLRRAAIDRCMEWITSHQEPSGDWAGIFPPMHVGTLAYLLEGYSEHDGRVRRALEAIEEFAWQDERGKRMQACVSPVWDTVLMSIALADIPNEKTTSQWCREAKAMRRSGLAWVKARQLVDSHGDWRIYRAFLAPGGFSFEYHNVWYPDVDDTAAAVIAFLKDDSAAVASTHILDAVRWILGMQSRDGGWAAFDVENDKLFLNKIPFSDMDSLCDPSTSDIVGRVLEAFGLFMMAAMETGFYSDPQLYGLLKKIRAACDRGIRFLSQAQTVTGAWYGRWGANFIYGTSNVLSGLAYHYHPDDDVEDCEFDGMSNQTPPSAILLMVRRAVRFLISIQNADGGWGESLETYRYKVITDENRPEVSKLCSAPSTPSQTAWALLAISPYLPTEHPAIKAGIQYLVVHQTVSGLESALKTSNPGKQREQSVSSIDPAFKLSKRATSPPSPPVSEQSVEDMVSTPAAMTWSTERYTGTGFPNHFYLGYTFYSHYFPMMALGGYLRATEQERSNTKWNLVFEGSGLSEKGDVTGACAL